jgi:hypothetical protein
MDLKIGALDRVLEALSPVLATELERLAQETRDGLEQDVQTRVQAAIDNAVEGAKNETRQQAVAELEQEYRHQAEAATMALREEVAEREKLEVTIRQLKDDWSAERASLQSELEQWRLFAQAQQELAEASSQSDMLSRFLRLTEPFAEQLAVYVARQGGLALWKSRGAVFPESISKETTDSQSYFRPITVRGNTVATICAAPSFRSDALDFLAASLERAIEEFGLRLRSPVPRVMTTIKA